LLDRTYREVARTTYVEERRWLLQAQLGRHRPDGADVRRDVLADLAVTAGRPLHVHAVLVSQRDRHAVDLQLADVAGPLADAALDAPAPRLQLLLAEHVVER